MSFCSISEALPWVLETLGLDSKLRVSLDFFPESPTTWSRVARVNNCSGVTIAVLRMLDLDHVSPNLVRAEFEIAQASGTASVGPEVYGFDTQRGLMLMRALRTHVLPSRSELIGSFGELLARTSRLDARVTDSLREQKRSAFLARVEDACSEMTPFGRPVAVYYELWKNLDSALGARVVDRSRFLHGDLNPTNILWSEGRLWLIDYDHAGMGNPLEDLATCAAAMHFSFSERIELYKLRYGKSPDLTEQLELELFVLSVLLRYGLDTFALRRAEVDGITPPPADTSLLPFCLSEDERYSIGSRVLWLSEGFFRGAVDQATQINDRVSSARGIEQEFGFDIASVLSEFLLGSFEGIRA